MATLSITGLAKSFGATAILRNITLAVPTGTLTAILGASGSGKTTLLRLIAGFETPDAGTIRLNTTTLAAPGHATPPEHRGIGYVAQDGALFPHLNIADNITFGLPRRQRRTRHRVAELLAMVDLPASYADRAPQSLSGGEQQRIALARALAPNPKLILLDEPFSALDAALRAETRHAVATAIAAAGATAILVTHDQEEALSMGGEVGILQSGQLAQLSTPQTLYRQPASADLANFIGEAVLLPGTIGHDIVYCPLGALALPSHQQPGPIGAPVQVMVRPEQIKLAPSPAFGGTAAIVTGVTFYGHDAVVTFALPGAPPGQTVKARIFSQSLPQIGAQLWLTVTGPVSAYPTPNQTGLTP